ncbi:MAG: hypothetical protein QF535_19190, partial [Anaerolineales bacterium]|nr:hypothetical protein [Anaerolineales bacterium]
TDSAVLNSYAQFTNGDSGSTSSDGLLVGYSSTNTARLWNQDSTNLEIGTGDTLRMHIDGLGPNAGCVGIGVALGDTSSLLHVDGTGDLLNISNGTNTLFYVNGDNGYAGIGTASPSSALHVQNGGVLTLGEAGVTRGYINVPATLNINIDSDSDASNTAIVFATDRTGASGGTELMTILDDGLVGIGTTTPDYTLEVNDLDKGLNVSGFLFVNSTNIGVGRSDPAQALDVIGSVHASSRVRAGGASVAFPHFTTSGDTNTGLYFDDSDLISIITGGVQRLTTDSSGQVGIGSTVPAALLDVNGTGDLFRVHNTTKTIFFVNGTNGRVGVRTTAPSQAFEVEDGNILIDSFNAHLIIDKTNGGGQAYVKYQTNAEDTWIAGLADSGFFGDGTEYFIGTSDTNPEFVIK